MPEISINLATHNRAAFLEASLVSLCEQTIAPERYEICVVNNACTDNTSDIVAQVAARYPRHRLFMVHEPIPGLSRARNCGLRATQSPLIANADDDGTVCPDWLERFLTHFATLGSDVAIVGGEINPVWGAPKPDWLTERMEWFLSAATGLGKQARFLEGTDYTSEGNSCFARAALEKAGFYPEELGRAGTCLLSGEQVVEARIRAMGGKIFFDPAIVLNHYIHADRLTPLWLRRRLFWQGVSSVAIRNYQIRSRIPVTEEAFINLPLKPEDWNFVFQDTPDKLEESMFLFHSLGFALALTGLLPIEDPTAAKANETPFSLRGILNAPMPANPTPAWLRHRFFWQGIADHALAAQPLPPTLDLPYDRSLWLFLNDANQAPTTDQLTRLRNLGFVLARTGFIPS